MAKHKPMSRRAQRSVNKELRALKKQTQSLNQESATILAQLAGVLQRTHMVLTEPRTEK